MGRPPIGKITKVTLPDGVPERIDAVAGKNRRAEFIREATVSELERREAEAAQTATKTNPKPAEGEAS